MTPLVRWINRLQVSDLRGLAAIGVDTTRDVTAVVEGVHRSVQATMGLPGPSDPGRTSGVTGLVYRSIDGVTRLTGASLRTSLTLLEPLARHLGHDPGASPERDVLLGVLNGVLGDRLEATGNPLAVPMTLFHRGAPLLPDVPVAASEAGGRILVMIHGLCMTEHGWRPQNRPGPDLGQTLAAHAGHTPVYLRYNSGRAIADNGLALATQLEALLARWPVPVEEIALLGHSMGGLVARSAVIQGEHHGHAWPAQLRQMIFLGTPHHGAPLERAGALADALLEATPWARPFTRLSRWRSRGIRDLRQGHTTPRGLASIDASKGVRMLAVAGTRSSRSRLERTGADPGALAGDGLVPVASALGRQRGGDRPPALAEASHVILPRTHHMELLRSRAVARTVRDWLTD